MGYSHYGAAIRGRAAWSSGKTIGTKRPLTQKQIWQSASSWVEKDRLRGKDGLGVGSGGVQGTVSESGRGMANFTLFQDIILAASGRP